MCDTPAQGSCGGNPCTRCKEEPACQQHLQEVLRRLQIGLFFLLGSRTRQPGCGSAEWRREWRWEVGGIAGPEMCARVGFRSPSRSAAPSSHTARCAGALRPEGFLRVFPASCTCVSRMPKEERLCGQQNHPCSRQAVGASFLGRPTGEEFQEGHSLLKEPEELEGRRLRPPRVTGCLRVTQPFGASSGSGAGELHGSLV